MTTTNLVDADRHAAFKDTDLLVLAGSFIWFLRDRNVFEATKVAADWQRALEARAPGAIALPLYAKAPQTRALLLTWLSEFESALALQPEDIPLERLEPVCANLDVEFKTPFAKQRLVEGVRRLRALLQPE